MSVSTHQLLRTGDLIDMCLSSREGAPPWLCVWIGGPEGGEIRIFFASTEVGIVKFREFSRDRKIRVLAR